jgi:D-glycero-D-manno-heptose 1,7-bisphosphate phosphatase
MGRYSSDSVSVLPSQPMNSGYISSSPYSQSPQMPVGAQQNPMASWPTQFPNPMVALDLHGILIEYVKDINSPSQLRLIPGAIESVKQLRLKGHKVFILTDYPGIARGKQTTQGAEAIHQQLMQFLGQAGCLSIDGLLYNTSDQKQDVFAKPNLGMINRAKNEMNIDFSNGYYVGDSTEDMVMAVKANLTPILILTGNGQTTQKKLSFELKQKVKVFPDLQSFVSSL